MNGYIFLIVLILFLIPGLRATSAAPVAQSRRWQ